MKIPRRRYYYFVSYSGKGSHGVITGSVDVNRIGRLKTTETLKELSESIAKLNNLDTVVIINYILLEWKWELC